MSVRNNQRIWRVVDANFNRAKEGLRVCEDIMRFALDRSDETKRYRQLRHQLQDLRSLTKNRSQIMLKARNIELDIGKGNTVLEFQRHNIEDIFYANSQRCKESIRVLEEFLKLVHLEDAALCKQFRYDLYALERKVMKILFKKVRG